MNTCPCGIARVDCEYHRPEPEPAHDDEWCVGRDVVVLQVSGETTIHGISPKRTVVRLSSDCGEYVRTYQDGKLVDEEPAEAYRTQPQCVASWFNDGIQWDNPESMHIGDVLRREDGSWRVVSRIDYANKKYCTDAIGGWCAYAIVPMGWFEVPK